MSKRFGTRSPAQDPGPPPEERLALLLCRAGIREPRWAETVRSLAQATRPAVLTEVLARHGLLGVGGSRLAAILGDDLSPEFAAAMQTHLEPFGAATLLLERSTRDVAALLEGEAIPALPLKGVLLAERIHGDSTLRPSGDIDVLVRRRDLEAARALLTAHGYGEPADVPDREAPPTLHYTFVAPAGWPPPVELHWRIHWYETRLSERFLNRSALGSDGIRQLRPEDELAALLLFYQRDSFFGLRLAADIAAWWETYGDSLPDGPLDAIALAHPEIADALIASAAVVERIVGVPRARLIGIRPHRPRLTGLASRLNDWRHSPSSPQLLANLGLCDLLLAPPGERAAFARRYVLQAPAVFAREHGLPEEARPRDHVKRYAHALARTGKSAYRYSAGIWSVRGTRLLQPLPPPGGESRKKAPGADVDRPCDATPTAASASRSTAASPSPESGRHETSAPSHA